MKHISLTTFVIVQCWKYLWCEVVVGEHFAGFFREWAKLFDWLIVYVTTFRTSLSSFTLEIFITNFPKAISDVVFKVHEVQGGIDRELRGWWQFMIERTIDVKLTSTTEAYLPHTLNILLLQNSVRWMTSFGEF